MMIVNEDMLGFDLRLIFSIFTFLAKLFLSFPLRLPTKRQSFIGNLRFFLHDTALKLH